MVKIIWTEFAIEDLQLIHDYISKDSKRYADRFIEKLIERVDQLETFPKSGRVVPDFNLQKARELIEGKLKNFLQDIFRSGVHNTCSLISKTVKIIFLQ